jgi:hypothetical protein
MSGILDAARKEGNDVLSFEAQQHWKRGCPWKGLLDTAQAHIDAFAEGEDLDRESGLHHLAHAWCYLGILIDYTVTHPECDDRKSDAA